MDTKEPQLRHLPWGPFSIAFFGMAFARAWLALVFARSTTPLAAPFSRDLFDVAFTVAALLMVLCARRLVPIAQKNAVYGASLGGMLVSSVLLMLWNILPPALLGPLGLAGSLVGGAAYLGCSMLNCEMLAGVSLLRALLYRSGSTLLASVLAFFFSDIGAVQYSVALLVFPVASVALIRAACESIPVQDRQKTGYPHFEMPWKLLGVVAAFMFAYGLNQHELVAGVGRHSSLSTALTSGLIFAAAYLFPRQIDISRLWRAPLPIMACGLLLMPTEGIFGQVVASYCLSTGLALIRLIVMLIFLDMAKRTGVAILPLVAANASLEICSLLGRWTATLIGLLANPSLAHMLTTVIACVVLVLALVLIASQRDLSSRWGVRVLSEGSLDQTEAQESRLASRCAYLVTTYRLTSREEEVLRELASGKDTQLIAQNLMIAPGTLRAHTRHIYEKMGIHTRKELEALVGAAPGTASAEETR